MDLAEFCDSQPSVAPRFPPALKSAIDAILGEYKRYQDDKSSWEYERAQLQVRISDVSNELNKAQKAQEVLTERVKLLEHGYVQERNRFDNLVNKIKTISTANESGSTKEVLKIVQDMASAKNAEASISGLSLDDSSASRRSFGRKSGGNFRSSGYNSIDSKAISPGREKLRQLLEEMGYKVPDAVSNPATPIKSTNPVSKGNVEISKPSQSISSIKKEESRDEEDESEIGNEVESESFEKEMKKNSGDGHARKMSDLVEDLSAPPTAEEIEQLKSMTMKSKGKGKKIRANLKWQSTIDESDKQWRPKISLRGHLDAVRSVDFLPEKRGLISGSEDGTVKLWNLATEQDVHTFYGHTSMVTSVLGIEEKNICLTAGADKRIMVWEIPDMGKDPFGRLGNACKYKLHTFDVHKDVVWDLKSSHTLNPSSKQLIFAASADATISVLTFDEDNKSVHSRLEFEDTDNGGVFAIPTSIAPLYTDENKLLAAYRSGHISLFDVEKSVSILSLKPDSPVWLTKAIVVPDSSLAFIGGDDNAIQFFDLNSGKIIHRMMAHTTTISSLVLGPSPDVLISADHDSTIRMWSISQRKCQQDLSVNQTHRRKNQEGVHSLAFHKSKSVLASGGADGIVKLYSQ